MAAGLGVVEERFGRPVAVVAHSIGAMATVLAFSERPPVAAVFLAPVLDLREPLGIFSDRARLAPWTARSLRRRVQRFTGELMARRHGGCGCRPSRHRVVVGPRPRRSRRVLLNLDGTSSFSAEDSTRRGSRIGAQPPSERSLRRLKSQALPDPGNTDKTHGE